MNLVSTLSATLAFCATTAFAFEGRITVTFTIGGETQSFLYTLAESQVRIERAETNWPHAKNIVDLDTGAVTLLFPHNRSFMRLKAAAQESAPAIPGAAPMVLPPRGLPPEIGLHTTPGAAPALPSVIGPAGTPGAQPGLGLPALPQLPPGIGPQSQPGTAAMPGVSAPGFGPAGGLSEFPALPMMPPMPMDPLELKVTDEKKEILGFLCTRYELKQGSEVMEIWATDKLPPFQPWLASPPPRFGPRMIEERWGALLNAKKLFPLLAVLKFEHGAERLRFKVKSVKGEKVKDADGKLFQPPPDYHELEPLPFQPRP